MVTAADEDDVDGRALVTVRGTDFFDVDDVDDVDDADEVDDGAAVVAVEAADVLVAAVLTLSWPATAIVAL